MILIGILRLSPCKISLTKHKNLQFQSGVKIWRKIPKPVLIQIAQLSLLASKRLET